MADRELCIGLVGLLLAALMASPWMVYWAKHRERVRARRKKKREDGN